MLRLNPDSPAFSALVPRETFLEEALFAHNPVRTAELMEEWQKSMPKLLELAVSHELGHALCEEPNEAAADRFWRGVKKRSTDALPHLHRAQEEKSANSGASGPETKCFKSAVAM